jgi:hypothetical protein
MKAITIRQPWAWAIITGRKKIENRSWPTSYRGRILVHAAMKYWQGGIPSKLTPIPPLLPTGAIVGSVEIVDCVRVETINDPFATGPWCWILRRPEAYRYTVPCRGQIGFWHPDHAAMNLLASSASAIAAPQ